MYVLAKNNSIVALNAATGKEIWTHSPGPGHDGSSPTAASTIGRARTAPTAACCSRAITSCGPSTRGPGKPIPSFGNDGSVDLKEGLGRDPEDADGWCSPSRRGACFEDLLILGSATNQGYGSAPGDIRAFDVRTGKAGLDLPHDSASRRVRLRHVAEGRVEDASAARTCGASSRVDEKRGIVYAPTASAEVQLLRRGSQRRESVRRLPARARCAHRQAAVAFPDGPPRHLGLRRRHRARSC